MKTPKLFILCIRSERTMSENTYKIEYAKQGRATCKYKKCSEIIAKDALRIGKMHPSPWGSDLATDWYHYECIFKAMENAKKDTKCPDSIEIIEGFDSIKEEDKGRVKELVENFAKFREEKINKPKTKTKKPKDSTKPKTEKQKGINELNITIGQMIPKKTIQEDILGLKKVIPQPWVNYLFKTIYDLEDNTKYISSESTIPKKDKIFESLDDLDPQNVKLIIFGPSPINNPESASGYAFYDSNVKYLNEKLPLYLENIINAAKDHSLNFGNNVDWESYKNNTIISWFNNLKKQGVLFLNTQLSFNKSEQTSNNSEFFSKADKIHPFWGAILLRIIKIIIEEKKSYKKSNGLVFAIMGEEMSWIKPLILKYYERIDNAFPIRFLVTKCPSSNEFNQNTNPCELIDSLLMETNNEPLNWFPSRKDIEKHSSNEVKKEAKPINISETKSSFIEYAWFIEKISKDCCIHSLDIKFHNKKFEFTKSNLKIDESSLPNKIALIQQEKGNIVTLKSLNDVAPIFVYNSADRKFIKLNNGEDIKLHHGDIISFYCGKYTYILETYENDVSQDLTEENKKKNKNTMELEIVEKSKKRKEPISWDIDIIKQPKKTKNKDDDDWIPTKKDKVDKDDYTIDLSKEELMEEEEDLRPLCKYGVNCYQKNPQHHLKFRHPKKK